MQPTAYKTLIAAIVLLMIASVAYTIVNEPHIWQEFIERNTASMMRIVGAYNRVANGQ